MHPAVSSILAIACFFAVIFGVQWIYAKYQEWMNSHSSTFQEKVSSWIGISILCILIVAISFGVNYGILNYGAWAIPAMLIVPYVWGIMLGWWHSWKSRGQKLTDSTLPDSATAADILKDAVIKIGCQPSMNDDGTISFSYQGENFHVEFGGRYARIWDPMWAGVKADDPQYPKIKEAVNSANFQFGPTVVMTTPDEDGVVGLHSHRQIMLHPSCPENVPYIQAVLDSFFEMKENVRESYKLIDQAETQKSQKRRPVGFNVSQDNTESTN